VTVIAPNIFDSILAEGMERFLIHKRAAGRRYYTEGTVLRLLDRYLIEQQITGTDQITPELLNAFLASRPRKRPRSFNHLLTVTRAFFSWLVQQGLLLQSPVQAKPRRNTAQRIPFIFDKLAAGLLLDAASRFSDRSMAPLRGVTYRTIFAVLYGLGLRVGEVSRLLIRDVDFQHRLLVIRETKFYKSRLVPFGPKMGELLREFIQARTQRNGQLADDTPLFSFNGNHPIHPGTISQTFHHLVPRLQLVIPPGKSSPRLHDLRHSFAVGTLLRWYRSGQDPGARLMQLATFLGHVDLMSTAVYLHISESLLWEANRRFESFAQIVLEEGVAR
jgi:site-specific recombinase XerD